MKLVFVQGKYGQIVGVVVLTLQKYFIYFVAYGVLTYVTLVYVSFLVISAINFSGGNLNLSGFAGIFSLLGIQESGTYDKNDIIAVYAKISLFFMVIGLVFSKVTSNKKLDALRKKLGSLKFKQTTITALMLLAQVSAYVPNAANGAKGLWWALVIFWAVGIFAQVMHGGLMRFAKISSKAVNLLLNVDGNEIAGSVNVEKNKINLSTDEAIARAKQSRFGNNRSD